MLPQLYKNKLRQTIVPTIILLMVFSSNFAFSEETPLETYGPVKTGDSLWAIAEKARTDKSISIEQLAFAIYKHNPKAFSSRNMNVIKTGAVLNIPDSETVNKISTKDAKKKLTEHKHALDVLRADAKKLQAAKTRQNKYKAQIKKRQKVLANYRHRSKDWNKHYLRLVDSKRNYAKSKRQVAKLKSLLLEKATLQYAKVKVPDSEEVAAIDRVNDKLGNIQTSLNTLNESNNTLVQKTEQLDTMSERLIVLEQELGKNDEIVIQMQKNLEDLKIAVEEQTRQNQKQSEQIEAIEKAQQTVAISVEENIVKKVEEAVNQAQMTTVKNVDETISSKVLEVVEQAQETTQKTVDETITTKMKEAIEQSQKTVEETINDKVQEAVASATEKLKEDQNKLSEVVSKVELKTAELQKSKNKNSDEIVSDVQKNTENANTANSTENLISKTSKTFLDDDENRYKSYADYFVEEITSSDKAVTETKTDSLVKTRISQDIAPASKQQATIQEKKLVNRQREPVGSINEGYSRGLVLENYKDKIILFGGILNGLILLFLLFRFFVKRPETVDIESEDNFDTPNAYQSWQDRAKPRH